MKKIILASTSKYRKKLMNDAGFAVECMSSGYEELMLEGVHPLELITLHARNKALAVSERCPHDIVIGSDQGLVDGDLLVGKPGTIDNACAQLESLIGKTVILATSVAVVCEARVLEYQNRARLRFRSDLTPETVRRYVLSDMPLDCAGSFMIESRGARLFSSIECDDPTAIQGLPVMRLNEMLVGLDMTVDCHFE